MKLYGLIGFPLGHSFSKRYFTSKFEKEKLMDRVFELFPIERIDLLPQLLKDQPTLCGLAVTIPYKQSVIPFLDEISDDAKAIGAVNCIQFNGKKLKGFNTDVLGFENSFRPLLKAHNTKALIIGTGGSSKAVQYLLNKLRMPFLVISRTPAGNEISYASITKQLLDEYTVIINCSPVGMTPNEDAAPAIPYEFISDKHYCYDLIYTPAETAFLKRAKENGASTMNGYEMLEIQAEANWDIWKSV